MKRLTPTQIEVVLKAMLQSRGALSRRAWAREHGLAEAYVRAVETGRQPPSERLLAAIGLETSVKLLRVGSKEETAA